MSVSVSGSSITFNDASTQTTAATGFGFKNRLINGDMRIDQRNAGASITGNNATYPVDRWGITATQSSKMTAQQNAGAVTPPSGFVNYLGITSSSAYSVLTGDTFLVKQPIEGLNISDLGWGSANAATITLSFWVRSSLTGTFGGALTNSAATRSYAFTYTVSSANTWEQKTVTVVGDTSGTWLTTNGIGIDVRFGLGSGSTFSTTANTWSAGNYVQPTGSVSVVGTNGATFYITGVQLEKGSTATSFDYRPYGTELQLCQRYYQRNIVATNNEAVFLGGVAGSATAGNRLFATLSTTMRANPTFNYNNIRFYDGSSVPAVTSIASQRCTTTIASVDLIASGGGMTTGRACMVLENGSNAYVEYTAEL